MEREPSRSRGHRVGSGEPDAGGQYLRCRPGALRIAHRILRDPDEAEDVYHEAFLRVLDRGVPAADGYLYRSVRNLAVDRRRCREVERRHREQGHPSPSVALLTLEAELRRRGGLRRLEELCEGWPPFRMQVFGLCIEQGYPSSAAARILGCSAKAIEKQRVKIRRDLDRLVGRLKLEGYEYRYLPRALGAFVVVLLLAFLPPDAGASCSAEGDSEICQFYHTYGGLFCNDGSLIQVCQDFDGCRASCDQENWVYV